MEYHYLKITILVFTSQSCSYLCVLTFLREPVTVPNRFGVQLYKYTVFFNNCSNHSPANIVFFNNCSNLSPARSVVLYNLWSFVVAVESTAQEFV